MMCFGLEDRKRLKTNHCVIVLLDDTQLVHELHASSTGQDLLDVAIKHLNLLETSYFGLKYIERKNSSEPNKVEQIWLDVNKSAIKQLKGVEPMTVYFGVKYYAADPCKLAEEITRYQFFLQCKQDILQSRLPISFELAIELFGLAVQSELGDFDPERHHNDYVSEFQFLPNQSIELERQVAQFHRTLRGQVPASAEMSFLERVKWLDLYGCELHPIQYEDNSDEYSLGLNPAGVFVLRNKLRVVQYLWSRITKTKCQGRCFLMDVMENKGSPNGTGKAVRRNRFGFRLADKAASQRLKTAIDSHKSFNLLVHDSARMHQLAIRKQQQQQQQHQHQYQQMKLSKVFRNSMRSAAHVAGLYSSEEQKLSSSIKSVGGKQAQTALLSDRYQSMDSRAQPSVVRVPSRRYSNRSLPRAPSNSLALMDSSSGNAHTMMDSQRHQALLMMMNQMNQSSLARSQTLRPRMESKEERRDAYYQQMMMMANHQQAPQSQIMMTQTQPLLAPPPEFASINAPVAGIYKSNSAIDGQLHHNDIQIHSRQRSGAMRSRIASSHRTGYESPKSTKSALDTGTTIQYVRKRLAHQNQTQDHYNRGCYTTDDYIEPPSPYYDSNISSKSLKNAQIAMRHRSKSINENLNSLHKSNHRRQLDFAEISQNKSSLLTTAQPKILVGAPPSYGNGNRRVLTDSHRNLQSEDESELESGPPLKSSSISGNHRQQPLLDKERRMPMGYNTLANRSSANERRQKVLECAHSDGEDGYCCSRSDCSSLEDCQANLGKTGRAFRKGKQKVAGYVKENHGLEMQNDDQKEWNAIRKRHNEFLLHGAFASQRNRSDTFELSKSCKKNIESRQLQLGPSKGAQLVKNIANKQATPILLSMNYNQNNVNNKAIELLNSQRQQLNSQLASGTQSLSSAFDLAGSSLASSPKGVGSNHQPQHHSIGIDTKMADSTASSSATSGYYAGSNSTRSASTDSDCHINGLSQANELKDEGGSRAKIALGSYGSRLASTYRPFKASHPNNCKFGAVESEKRRGRFYLGEYNGTKDSILDESAHTDQSQNQWLPQVIGQSQHPQPNMSSSKYVSFDV